VNRSCCGGIRSTYRKILSSLNRKIERRVLPVNSVARVIGPSDANFGNIDIPMMRIAFIISCTLILAASSFAQSVDTSRSFVKSKDGTRIAVECTGTGPSLLIVHGGSGDRSRWKPLLPFFAPHFTVCAMDRRGHGESAAGLRYSLRKEFEDVAAVINSRPGQVFVLGHSFGGVCALEAAFLTNKIAKLVLYEPPLQDLDHTPVAKRMAKMIRAGERERALETFLAEVVMITPAEIAAMKQKASWPSRVSSIDIQIREIQALSKYRFDAKRMKKVAIPTLLLKGNKTASAQLNSAIDSLRVSLRNPTLLWFEGEGHNAMDNIPEQFANAVTIFLKGQ